MRVETEHARYGRLPVRNPMIFSHTPVQYNSAPPELGQNNVEILSKLLCKTPEQIRVLAEARVI